MDPRKSDLSISLRWLLVSLSPSASESGHAMRTHNLNGLTDRVCKSCCERSSARKNRPRQPQTELRVLQTLLLLLCLVRLLRLLRWLLVSLSPSACESGYAMRAHNLNRLTD